MELEEIYVSLNGISPVSREAWADLRLLFETQVLQRNASVEIDWLKFE